MQAELALADFGFTDLEARLYCELLRSAPATGYRLSQQVGKAPANVYQALAGMAKKGVVFTDDGESKSYRALPPHELMNTLQEDFERRRIEARDALAKVYTRPERDRIYQLQSPRQLLDRARSMIASARDILLFDLFPEPFEALRANLETAATSGVTVAGVTYGPLPQAGFTCVQTLGAELRNRWPGQQLTVIADAREYLMGLLSEDGEVVLHGMWSESPYLACMQHNGLSCEIRLSALNPAVDPLAHLGLLKGAPDGLVELRSDNPTIMRSAMPV